MKPARVRAIAHDLIAASDQVAIVSPPSESGDFTFTDAYAVAGLLHERRVRAGRVPAGVKLGFTNRVVWDELGLDAPFWAYMYRDTVDRTPRVSTAELVQPKIEPEIVVGLKECLRRGSTRPQIAEAVGWAAIGIEVVHCHYPGWVMTPTDALADGGLHAMLRYGRKVEMNPGLLEGLAKSLVELECDHALVATGVGANALGGPLDALCWLLDLDVVPDLPAGSVITTGTLTVAPPAEAGQRWVARASAPLGEEFVVEIE